MSLKYAGEHRPLQESGEQLAREKCKRLGIVEPRTDFSKIGGGLGPNGKLSMLTTMATGKAPYGDGETFLKAYLGGVSCPTLVAMGEFDPNLVAKPGGADDIVAALLPVLPAKLRIMEACGHASVVWRPTLVAMVLLDYLCAEGLHTGAGAEKAARAVAEGTFLVGGSKL